MTLRELKQQIQKLEKKYGEEVLDRKVKLPGDCYHNELYSIQLEDKDIVYFGTKPYTVEDF